jgi:hypothetical protein
MRSMLWLTLLTLLIAATGGDGGATSDAADAEPAGAPPYQAGGRCCVRGSLYWRLL